MELDLARIARQLRGRVVPPDSIAFAGPGRTLRNCTLRISVASPTGFIVFAGIGEDKKQVEEFVSERLGLGGRS